MDSLEHAAKILQDYSELSKTYSDVLVAMLRVLNAQQHLIETALTSERQISGPRIIGHSS